MHDRALGYTTGAIADPGVTLRQRHIITVNCMDQAAICGLIQTCLLVAGGTISPNAQAFYYAPTTTSLNPAFLGSTVAFYLAHTVAIDVGGNGQASVPKHAPVHANLDPHREFIGNKKPTQHAREPGIADIYRDTAVFHMLHIGGLHGSVMTPIQVCHVSRHSCGYRAEHDIIMCVMINDRHHSNDDDRHSSNDYGPPSYHFYYAVSGNHDPLDMTSAFHNWHPRQKVEPPATASPCWQCCQQAAPWTTSPTPSTSHRAHSGCRCPRPTSRRSTLSGSKLLGTRT